MSRPLRFVPLVLYMGLITFLSSRSGRELPTWSFMRFDKVLHTLEYGGLGFLLANALSPSLRRRLWVVLLSAAAGLAFGVVDEFHQSFVPGRQGNDLGDMTADLVGSILGACSFVVLVHLFFRRKAAAS